MHPFLASTPVHCLSCRFLRLGDFPAPEDSTNTDEESAVGRSAVILSERQNRATAGHVRGDRSGA